MVFAVVFGTSEFGDRGVCDGLSLALLVCGFSLGALVTLVCLRHLLFGPIRVLPAEQSSCPKQTASFSRLLRPVHLRLRGYSVHGR